MSLTIAAETGTTLYFGRNGQAGKTLLEGWAHPEEHHHWNDGFEASLDVRLAIPPSAALQLTVEVRPHLGPGLTRQDVTLYFNGFRLGFWRLERLDGYTLSAEIEPEFWLKRDGIAWGKCTWHLPNSTMPSTLARTEDNRLLGLCFQSFGLGPLPLKGRR